MSFQALDWGILIVVPIIAWLLGRSGRPAGSWRGYFLAQQQMSTIRVASTYFGANLTFTAIFLILSEQGYLRGAWVFSVPIFWLIGTLLFVFCYPKLRPYAQKGMTLHQALGEAFGSPRLQRWASAWTILAFVGTVALEFYGGIKLLQWALAPQMTSQLSFLTSLSAALLLAFIVSSFTVRGGLGGVARADMWLDIVTFAGVFILFYYLWPYIPIVLKYMFSPANLSTAPTSPISQLPPVISTLDNVAFVLAMAVIFIPFQFCTLDSWQRIGAWAKREETDRPWWLITSGAALAMVYVIPVCLGIAVRQQGLSVPADSHPLKVFLDMVHLPVGLLGLVFAGFISAMLSTADELLNCCSLSLLFDAFQLPRSDDKRTRDKEKEIVASGQFYTGLFGFLAALIALAAVFWERAISDMALAVFSSQVVFVLPLFTIFFFPRIARRIESVARWATIISFGVAICLVAIGVKIHDKPLSDGAPVAAFLVALILYVAAGTIVSLRGSKGSEG